MYLSHIRTVLLGLFFSTMTSACANQPMVADNTSLVKNSPHSNHQGELIDDLEIAANSVSLFVKPGAKPRRVIRKPASLQPLSVKFISR